MPKDLLASTVCQFRGNPWRGNESCLPEIFAAIAEDSDDAIVCEDLNGIILRWNTGAEKQLGYSSQEMINQPATRIIPPELLEEDKRVRQRLKQGEKIGHFDSVRIRKDGGRIDLSLSISPIRGADGNPIAACTIGRDISARKKIEKELRRSEERANAVLNIAADAIITIDESGNILFGNLAMDRLFGYKSGELIGKPIAQLMPEPYHSEHDGYIRRFLRTGRAKIIGMGREVVGKRKDGSLFPMHLVVGEVRSGSQRLFTGIVHDLTDRRKLERQIIEAAASEQRRIGQDLHDGLCQDLVGIALTIDGIRTTLPDQKHTSAEALRNLAASVRVAAGHARDLSHGLNPVDVRAGGLCVAMENLATKVSDTFRVNCSFTRQGVIRVPDDGSATHLYRIAQEAISNAIRHGRSSQIRICLSIRRKRLTLTVNDNGCGIEQEKIDAIKQGVDIGCSPHRGADAGIGLETMQYRARVIGGTFSLGRNEGGGTVVSCTIGPKESAVTQRKTKTRA